MRIKKLVAILIITIFTTNLSALNFCGEDTVDTGKLSSDFKKLKKALRAKLESSTSSEKRNIKKSSEYKALSKKKSEIKCVKYQRQYNRYNRYENNDYRDSKSSATIFNTIKYLNSAGKTEALKKIISDLEKNQIAKLSQIKWKDRKIFGLDIGFKKDYYRALYVGFFYLENGEAKYKQYTKSNYEFKPDKRVRILNIDFDISDEESKIALAFEIENALGKDKFQKTKSLKDYLAENKVTVFLDNAETKEIYFLSVSEIKPSLDEVGFYLRDGKYTFEIKSYYQNEYEFENGESKMSFDLSEGNEIRISVKRISAKLETNNEELTYGNSPNSQKAKRIEPQPKYLLICESTSERYPYKTENKCKTKALEKNNNLNLDCECKLSQ